MKNTQAVEKSRKYAWGTLTISADMSQASAPIRYRVDDGEPKWYGTGLQTADARHDWNRAFALVNARLKSEN